MPNNRMHRTVQQRRSRAAVARPVMRSVGPLVVRTRGEKGKWSASGTRQP